MNSRAWLIIAVEFLAAVVVVLVLSSQLTKQKARPDNAESLAKQRQEIINDMQTRQRDVAALDAKYTKELADAQAETAALQHKLDNGGRVRVKGNCPSQPSTTPAPPAWAMMEPSNSLQLLDETFSVSDLESSATSQH